jgi:hypothetical protein
MNELEIELGLRGTYLGLDPPWPPLSVVTRSTLHIGCSHAAIGVLGPYVAAIASCG